MDIEIQPADLKFKFQLNKQLLSTLTFNNPTNQRVAYKIKTTAPKKYVVRPSSGIVEAKSIANIQVIMQAQKEYPNDSGNKDKFMVQTTVVSETDQPDSKDLFGPGRIVKEQRLKVHLDGPAAPPSPVAEHANEGEDDVAQPAVRSPAAAPAITAENQSLKSQLEKIVKERDELSRKHNMIVLQNQQNKSPASSAPHAEADIKFKVTLLQLILVALIAFLVGHFT